MKCFPFMIDIEGRRCLLVGGGEVARRKAEKLLPFGVRLEVCAHTACAALAPFHKYREYLPSLLNGAAFVVAATDDGALNARVAEDCRARGILVNCADDRENCDFFFPALIARGNVTVGISTGGASPALAAALRARIEALLPRDLDEIAGRAAALRGTQGYAPFIESAFGGDKDEND